MQHHLDTASKLRLRQRFSRWLKAPHLFSDELAAAQEAIDQCENNPGWTLSVDRAGIPQANPPANMTLTPAEKKRFAARLATMTDEAEINRTTAAMAACVHRGFVASVDSQGRLQAKAPHSKVKPVLSDPAKALSRQKRFYRSFLGGTPSTLPAKA